MKWPVYRLVAIGLKMLF